MINHTGEMTIMNINSRRREQNLTNDADRSCESHHSLSRTRRVKRFPHSTSPLIQMDRLVESKILKKKTGNGGRTENQTPKWAKILAIRRSGSLKEQNAPRVHFQIESFGMERPGGVQKVT